MSEEQVCVTCGTVLQGEFCHVCGEKVLGPEDLRVTRFLRRAAVAAFSADSQLWRSFRLLLTRPGQLTLEFVRGRRQPYVHPLQLFLFANLVLFLMLRWFSGFNTFTTRVEWHVRQPVYGAIARDLIEAKAPAGSPEAAAYLERFNAVTPNYANSMVILTVPMIALGISLLFIRRREPFVKHLAFAIHFMAFVLLVTTFLPYPMRGIAALFPATESWMYADAPVSLLLSTIFSVYVGVGIWRAYGDRPALAVVKGIVGALTLMPALLLYRAILFFAVYFTLD